MLTKLNKNLKNIIAKALMTISKTNGTIIIIGQLDCDGVCSSGMIKIALERGGISNKYFLVKSLDTAFLNELRKLKPELVLHTMLMMNWCKRKILNE